MARLQVVFAEDYVVSPTTAADARLCAGAFPAGTFSGQIVVCERGTYGRVAKGQSVADRRRGRLHPGSGQRSSAADLAALVADPHVIPAVHITYTAYQALRAYMDAAPGPVMGTIPGATFALSDDFADIMADFSSRGPNRGTFASLITPSVTAPGRQHLGCLSPGPGGDGDYTWNVIGGTSMASPHAAGAGALMKALYPDWSPAQIESALMTTAYTGTLDDDGVTPATPVRPGLRPRRPGHGRASRPGAGCDHRRVSGVRPAAGGDVPGR